MKVVPTITGCLGGGMKNMKVSDKFSNTIIMIKN